MGKYENGAASKHHIVNTAARLFYENGYDETGMDDISRAAHMRRSSIYYHFKSKEQILDQIIVDMIRKNELIAEKYCDVPEYLFTLAMAILWQQFLYDERFRRLQLQWAKNNPMYTGNKQAFPVHLLCYQRSANRKLEVEQIRELSAASAYGLVVYIVKLAGERYDTFTAEELVRHCMTNIGRLYHLEEDIVEHTWNDVLPYIRALPLEDLKYWKPE